MTCEKTQRMLDDYIDGTLSVLQEEDVNKHCATCESCARSLQGLSLQKKIVKSLLVPPASSRFNENVITSAIENAEVIQNAESRRSGFYKFATAAMISALVLWLGFFTEQAEDNKPYLIAVDDQVRTITVAIDSVRALDSVSMHVELSDNLELSGFGNKKQIKWTTGLRKGVNVISLPIVGIAQGKGNITTRIHLNGKEKVMRITTEYKSPDSVLYQADTVLQG